MSESQTRDYNLYSIMTTCSDSPGSYLSTGCLVACLASRTGERKIFFKDDGTEEGRKEGEKREEAADGGRKGEEVTGGGKEKMKKSR